MTTVSKRTSNYFHGLDVIRTKLQQGGWKLHYCGPNVDSLRYHLLGSVTQSNLQLRPQIPLNRANFLIKRHNVIVDQLNRELQLSK